MMSTSREERARRSGKGGVGEVSIMPAKDGYKWVEVDSDTLYSSSHGATAGGVGTAVFNLAGVDGGCRYFLLVPEYPDGTVAELTVDDGPGGIYKVIAVKTGGDWRIGGVTTRYIHSGEILRIDVIGELK